MYERYRWNDLIKVKTKEGEYIEERPTKIVKPLIYSEVREVHRKSLARPYFIKRNKTNGENRK